jgi:hypothetical protein
MHTIICKVIVWRWISGYWIQFCKQWSLNSYFSLGVLKENELIWKNDRSRSLYKMNKWNKLVQEPQKLNNGSRKTVHLGTIDCGFTIGIRGLRIQYNWTWQLSERIRFALKTLILSVQAVSFVTDSIKCNLDSWSVYNHSDLNLMWESN